MILQRILATVLGVALLAAVLVFTSILLAIGLTAALVLGGWIWWRGRGRVPARRGRIVEGESRVVDDQNYHLRP
jgi:hypothetical protein